MRVPQLIGLICHQLQRLYHSENSLHDAQVVSIRSNLLDRTMDLFCEIEHLSKFHKLDEGFQFILHLESVQSARVLRYAVWPGECSILEGLSVEEQRKVVAEYQAKWREESASWNEFESRITREDEQVFDISDAALQRRLGVHLPSNFVGTSTTLHITKPTFASRL